MRAQRAGCYQRKKGERKALGAVMWEGSDGRGVRERMGVEDGRVDMMFRHVYWMY